MECEMRQGFVPDDPKQKRSFFYVFVDKEISALSSRDTNGVWRTPIYLDDGRLIAFAGLNGGVTDEHLLRMLEHMDSFKKLIHSIGVSASSKEPHERIGFDFICYGSCEEENGSRIFAEIPTDGTERIVELSSLTWEETDDRPGQFCFLFPDPHTVAKVTIRFYLNDGYDTDILDPDPPVLYDSDDYNAMIRRSLLSCGNYARVKRFLEKLRKGEHPMIAFIGGSITQGAGAVPIRDECYARKTWKLLCEKYGSCRYVKAGVGGTPSQLGLIRYERDVKKDGDIEPDIVVVEFAVNDLSDETKGVCYESLIKKIWDGPEEPAIILLFSVFANDWNLKERLAPIGFRYELPMVDVRDAVSPQFGCETGDGLVVTKRQFFYDVYHPSNIGHRIMADCLLHLFDRIDAAWQTEDMCRNIPPLYGTDFARMRLLDRKQAGEPESRVIRLTCGGFTEYDTDLQSVPLDDQLEDTPQFPYNWMWRVRSGIQSGIDPDGRTTADDSFFMEICCRSLMLVYKDSGKSTFGRARVVVDEASGDERMKRTERIMDPREAGWTHCHATVLVHGSESLPHTVRITPEDPTKTFTILGFGYVP